MSREHHHPLGAGRDRRRHPRPRRPRPVRQHHEPGVPRLPRARSPTALEAEKDSIRGVIVTSAKKTFFAGGDLKRPDPGRAPSTPRSVFDGGMAHQARTCAASRPSASPSSPRSTARRSAAATRSPSPATTASPSTRPAPRSACPRSPSACCPAAAASSARYGCSASPTPCSRCCSRAPSTRPRRALENGLVARGRRHPRGDARQGPRLHRRQPRVAAALGRARATDPRRHPVQPEVRGEPARLPGQPAQAD